MSQTLVVGSVALDTIETQQHGKVVDSLGGSASYGAVSASYFARTSLIGIVGSDFPKRHIRMFEKRGIDVSGLEVRQGLTFRWHGYYERNMNFRHTNTTELNVFQHFSPKLASQHRDIPFVFLANIHPDLQLHVLKQVRSPRLVVMDTMNFWIEGAKTELTKVIRKTDVLVIADSEACQYAETWNTVEAGDMLRKLGPRAVIIKKGENGALVFLKDRIYSVPAVPVRKLKDPTGAGDTFAGAMTGYMSRLGRVTDDNIIRGVIMGCVMASFLVEDFSVQRILRIKPHEISKRAADLTRMVALPSIDAKSVKPLDVSKKGK